MARARLRVVVKSPADFLEASAAAPDPRGTLRGLLVATATAVGFFPVAFPRRPCPSSSLIAAVAWAMRACRGRRALALRSRPPSSTRVAFRVRSLGVRYDLAYPFLCIAAGSSTAPPASAMVGAASASRPLARVVVAALAWMGGSRAAFPITLLHRTIRRGATALVYLSTRTSIVVTVASSPIPQAARDAGRASRLKNRARD